MHSVCFTKKNTVRPGPVVNKTIKNRPRTKHCYNSYFLELFNIFFWVVCLYRAPFWKERKMETLSPPVHEPHPHFPCLFIMERDWENVMHCVVETINEKADTVIWRSSGNHNRYKVSATVFLDTQRIALSVYLFATTATQDGKKRHLLQALCESGYGWDFFSLWESIVDGLQANGKRVQKYVPELEQHQENKEKNKLKKQPSLADQLYAAQIPAHYSTMWKSTHDGREDLTITAPSSSSSSSYSSSDTVLNLLRSWHDNERCTGIDLLCADNENNIQNESMQKALFGCVGSDNAYAKSRIRALSLVILLVQKGVISNASESLQQSIEQGLDYLVTEFGDSESGHHATPAYKNMLCEYAELGVKAISPIDTTKRLNPRLASRLQSVLETWKKQ